MMSTSDAHRERQAEQVDNSRSPFRISVAEPVYNAIMGSPAYIIPRADLKEIIAAAVKAGRSSVLEGHCSGTSLDDAWIEAQIALIFGEESAE